MKKFSLILLALALAFGMMVVGCDDGSTDDNGGQTSSNPFKGTWTGTFRNQNDFLNGQTVTMVIEDTTWSWVASNDFEVEGTYTYSGNTANLLMIRQRVNSSSPWNVAETPMSQTVTVSGNTITGNGETFTRVR